MKINYKFLQFQDDKIYSYFRTTTEPFDFLEWDGEILQVWSEGTVVEKYLLEDLQKI